MSIGDLFVRKQKLNKFKYFPERKFTCDMGELVPIMYEEVLPGDVWKLNATALIRLQPMVFATMHDIKAYTHWFFVPYRLLQDNFERFITGGEDGQDNTAIPTVNSGDNGWLAGSLADYLGYTTGVSNLTATAYAFRAYNLVYNEWYRNQNVTQPVALSKGDGSDTTTNQTLLHRCWMEDYFTACLPFAQRSANIMLPLDTEASVTGKIVGNGQVVYGYSENDSTERKIGVGGAFQGASSSGLMRLRGIDDANITDFRFAETKYTTRGKVGLDFVDGKADLTTASAVSVNELRDAVQLQVAAEIAARTGGRYVEYLLGNFGVRSSDARLQRPEYLGGGVSSVLIEPIYQTSGTDQNGTPQANIAGKGISVNTSHAFKHKFTEHGAVIGIMSIMPKTGYFQGLRRQFNRKTRLDFALPVFSHLGERQVPEVEIFAQSDNASTTVSGVSVSNTTTFGYLPQYEEYRQMPSSVHGDFKTNLKAYHLDREFANPPLLNDDFTSCTPSKRIFAVTNQNYDSCMVEIGYNITAWRPLPKQGVPMRMDHLF